MDSWVRDRSLMSWQILKHLCNRQRWEVWKSESDTLEVNLLRQERKTVSLHIMLCHVMKGSFLKI